MSEEKNFVNSKPREKNHISGKTKTQIWNALYSLSGSTYGIFHLGCHDYLHFSITVLVINTLPLNSEFSLFACSVKMDLSLLNNIPLSTGMMLSFSVQSTGKTVLPGSGLAPWKAPICGEPSQHGAPVAHSCWQHHVPVFPGTPSGSLDTSHAQLSQAPARTDFWQVPPVWLGCHAGSCGCALSKTCGA